MSQILINIDVPDLQLGLQFYEKAFGLKFSRKIGAGAVELLGFPSPIYLLEKKAGSLPYTGSSNPRSYERHWSPLHLDIVVDLIEPALKTALAAGARLENDIRTEAWGKIAMLSDPFGNGFCLIQFTGKGYGELDINY